MRPQPFTIGDCKPARDTQTPVWDTNSQHQLNPLQRGRESNHMKHPLRILTIALIFHLLLLLVCVNNADAKPIKGLPCPQWHDLLRKYKLPVEIFAPIIYRESRCTPKAVGWNYKKGRTHKDCKLAPAAQYRHCKYVSSYDSGLLQINSSWKSVTKSVCKSSDMLILLKPDCNLRIAKVLYGDGKGISNWKATSGGTITKNNPK